MPGLRYYDPQVVITDGSVDLARRAKPRLGRHRGMDVNGDTALMAFHAGDGRLNPAPTFIIDLKLYALIENAEWNDFDPVLCAEPPDFAFYLRPSEPFKITVQDNQNTIEANIDGFFALTIGEGRWILSEMLQVDQRIVATETIATLPADQVWNPHDRPIGSYAPLPICNAVKVGDLESPRTDCQKLARNLVSFLYIYNSSAIDLYRRHEAGPKNRAERRQATRSPVGPVFEVRLKHEISVEGLLADMHAGRRLGPRIVGAKRTEVRHDKFPVTYTNLTERYLELQRKLHGTARDLS